MAKGSPEQKAARRCEIMSACLSLYQTKSFRDISMGDIADFTSFSRPSIYNYFETKEEISSRCSSGNMSAGRRSWRR